MAPSNQLESDRKYESLADSIYYLSEPSKCDSGRCINHHQIKSMELVHIVNTRFSKAVDYQIFTSENRSNKYDYTVSKNLRNMSKRITYNEK